MGRRAILLFSTNVVFSYLLRWQCIFKVSTVCDENWDKQKKFMNFNKLWFPWKPVHFRLGTISENVCISDRYQCAKFHACVKRCTVCLKFRVVPLDYCIIID